MYVKMMKADSLPDSDPHKRFDLFGNVEGVNFISADDNRNVVARIVHSGGQWIERIVEGTVYMMDDHGKTISKFTPGKQSDGVKPESYWDQQFHHLVNAVYALYYSAYWKADRDVNENRLWADVRDAAGFTPGLSLARLGEPRWKTADMVPFNRGRWIAAHINNGHVHGGKSHYEMGIDTFEDAAAHVAKYHNYDAIVLPSKKAKGEYDHLKDIPFVPAAPQKPMTLAEIAVAEADRVAVEAAKSEAGDEEFGPRVVRPGQAG